MTIKHGACPKGRPSKEYRSWLAMKARCLKPSHPYFKTYSSLGIDPEWAFSFPAFLREIGYAPSEKHTIDRVDTAKGYFPGNVRWATPYEQSQNRKDNLIIEVDGVSITASEACRTYGIKRSTLNERVRRGYTGKSLIAPVGSFGRWNPAN